MTRDEDFRPTRDAAERVRSMLVHIQAKIDRDHLKPWIEQG